MANDNMGLPYSEVDHPYGAPTPFQPIQMNAMTFHGDGNDGTAAASEGMSDAGAANIAGAGVGAASTAAKAILNSIASQNALNFQSQQNALGRASESTMNRSNRDLQAKNTSMMASRGAESNQLQAGATGLNAKLGGQSNQDGAIMAMADRLAKIYSK